MRYYMPGVVVLAVLLAGCGGWQGPTTGHAVGFVYVATGTGTAQGQPPTLQLLPAATADPNLRAVSGAIVTVVQLSRSTVTTIDGSYGIFNLEPGTYSR